jgi:zinc transporter ZupT
MIASAYSSGHDDHGHRLLEEHDDHDDEGETAATWRWGASVMGGFLFPVFLHIFFPTLHYHTHPHGENIMAKESEKLVDESCPAHQSALDLEQSVPTETVKEDSEPIVKAVPVNEAKDDKTEASSDDGSSEEGYETICGCLRVKNLSLFVSMNLGEALHAFTDGIFVGAAYLVCGNALGNSVVLSTVLHELSNQLAGYLVMVNQNGIKPIVALGLNFLFGLATLLGALLVLSLDMGNVAVGCIFGIGAGIFLHVAIAEMLGTAERNVERKQHFLWVILAFVLGAIAIGLVLLDHVHCGEH